MAQERTIEYILSLKDNLSQGLEVASTKLEGVGKNLKKVGGDFAGLSLAAGAALAAVGVGSVKAAVDFESSFAGVKKTVDATAEEFAQLATNFRDISKTTPLAIDKLNAIGEMAGSLGISGVDNITKFTDTIAKIAITTNLTEEEAASSFARIANIMQEPLQNIDRMGAVVVDLGNKMATTEREITEFAQRIAGAGKIAGLSTRDIFGIGAAMASVGVEAEAGGTAVQKVLLEITKSIQTGDEKLAVFAKTAGMSAKDFAAEWKGNAGEIFTAFVQGLGKAGDDAINILSDLGLEDQRLLRSFLSLANAGDLLNDAMNGANQGWRENNALSEEARKRFETTASQLQILKNNVMDVAISLGQMFLPVINQIVQAVIPAINAVVSWAQQHETAAKAIGIFAAVVLGLIAVIAPLALIIGGVIVAIGSFAGIILAIAIPVVAALAAGAYLLMVNWEQVKAWFIAFGQKIAEIWQWIKQSFISGVQAAIDGFKQLPEAIAFLAGFIYQSVINHFQNIYSFWTSTVPAMVRQVINWFSELPAKIGAAARSLWENTKAGWFACKDNLIQWAKDTVDGIMQWFSDLPGRVVDAVRGAGSAAKEKLSSILDAFGSGRDAAGRAAGGQVQAGRPFMVGERGPELFIPHGSGRIEPKIGAQNVTININASSDVDIPRLVDEIKRAIGIESINAQFGVTR